MYSPYTKAAKSLNPRETPQHKPIPNTAQVPNSAGGYAWNTADADQLLRFLILGTEGGTYYVEEKELTDRNVKIVLKCLQNDPIKTIDTIVGVSIAGRAPKNDPALLALAIATCDCRPEVRTYALISYL